MGKMIYKGNGFYVGIPARDLSAKEVKRYGHDLLLSLGLYEDAEQPKPKAVKAPKYQPKPKAVEAKSDEPEKAEEA